MQSSIITLIESFGKSCVPQFPKECIGLIRSLDNKVLQPYTNVKALKRHLSLDSKQMITDQERYNYLVQFVISHLRGKLDHSLVTPETFYQKLERLMTEKYSESDFKKSMNAIIKHWINLIEYEFEEDEESTDVRPKYDLCYSVRPYGDDFISLLEPYRNHVYHWHVPLIEDQRDHETMIALVKDQILKGEFVFTLLIGDTELYAMTDGHAEFSGATTGIDLISQLQNPTASISLGPVHQITLDTIKRNLMNGHKTSFSENVRLMNVYTEMFFSRGIYLRNHVDFNGHDEHMLHLVIKNFPNGFEDLAKWGVAKFVFNGHPKDVNMISYWISLKPINKLMDKFDYDQFTWETMNTDTQEFFMEGLIGHSVLH